MICFSHIIHLNVLSNDAVSSERVYLFDSLQTQFKYNLTLHLITFLMYNNTKPQCNPFKCKLYIYLHDYCHSEINTQQNYLQFIQ
jgi:hypothetical protein